MNRKDIVIVSGMLLLALVVFLATWLTSYRGKEDASDAQAAAESTSGHQTLSSEVSPALTRAANRDSRPPRASSVGTRSGTDLGRMETERESQGRDLTGSAPQYATLQEDAVPQNGADVTAYTVLHESFQSLGELQTKVQAISDELHAQRALIGTGTRVDPEEYGRSLDESDAIQREILALCRDTQTMAPDAIEIKEVQRVPLAIFNTALVNYVVLIRRERLEEVFGTMPEDVAHFFPDIAAIQLAIPADENFSYVEARRELDRQRAAQPR